MTEEIKNVEQQEKTCVCQSKLFKKFLVIATGSFVGVFCALSLFAALHKPPMMHPAMFHHHMKKPMPCHCKGHFYGHKFKHDGMHKKHIEKRFEQKSDFNKIKK